MAKQTRKNRRNRSRKQRGGTKLLLSFAEPLTFTNPKDVYGPGYNNDDNFVPRMYQGQSYDLMYTVKDGSGRVLYYQSVTFGPEQMAALKMLGFSPK